MRYCAKHPAGLDGRPYDLPAHLTLLKKLPYVTYPMACNCHGWSNQPKVATFNCDPLRLVDVEQALAELPLYQPSETCSPTLRVKDW